MRLGIQSAHAKGELPAIRADVHHGGEVQPGQYPIVLDRCSHPRFRDDLWAYYRKANEGGGHLPYSLEGALRFEEARHPR